MFEKFLASSIGLGDEEKEAKKGRGRDTLGARPGNEAAIYLVGGKRGKLREKFVCLYVCLSVRLSAIEKEEKGPIITATGAGGKCEEIVLIQ